MGKDFDEFLEHFFVAMNSADIVEQIDEQDKFSYFNRALSLLCFRQ